MANHNSEGVYEPRLEPVTNAISNGYMGAFCQQIFMNVMIMFELLVCGAVCILLQFLILVEMGLFKEALDNFSLIPIFFSSKN